MGACEIHDGEQSKQVFNSALSRAQESGFTLRAACLEYYAILCLVMEASTG